MRLSLRKQGKWAVVPALMVIGATAWADYPVAGVEPWHRPTGAPEITRVHHDAKWYAHALHGVSQPYPASLRFLENQGNWYTPFNRPGMLPPYDIRGWYAGKR